MTKFYPRILSCLFFLVCLVSLKAQQVSLYSFASSTGTYTALSGGTTSAGAIGDDGTDNLAIGFNFVFGGVTYTNAIISTNGAIKLATSAATAFPTGWTNNLSNSYGAPIIGALWDDHNASGGTVNYRLQGVAGSRTFTVEWNNIHLGGGGSSSNPTGNFQAILFEGTNVIQLRYGTTAAFSSVTASIGLNDLSSFLSVTPAATATASSATANNNISSNTNLASGTVYTFTPPTGCTGAPIAGTTTATPGTVCYGGTVSLALTGGTTGGGITYQWQSSPISPTVWTDITGATSSSYVFAATGSFQYRAKVTCTNSSLTDFSVPLAVSVSNVPIYATLPYTQDFESWVNGCGTTDRPSVNWGSVPFTGDNSWRRDDQGASSSWTSNTAGYSPVFTTGAHSARFHSYDASSGTQGSMDLFIDLSSSSSTKYLKFDYINISGTDVVKVFVSTDGGLNFTQSGASLGVQATWGSKEFAIASNSATTIIRLQATSDFGFSDIGIDNLSILPSCSGTPVAGTATASSNPVCYGNSTTLSLTGVSAGVGGLSYQWQSSPNGTTWTNIAGATSNTYIVNGVTSSLQYRAVVTCANGGATANSTAVIITAATPTYATLPYSQGFENWINGCATTDRPDASWGLIPVMSDSAWRRDDLGASANWTLAGSGGYSPVFSVGAHSARFHTYEASNTTRGIMDLFINLSSSTQNKLLKFDYINTTGSDSLTILLSNDGGVTFTRLDSITTRATWSGKQITIASNSATAVIRFMATSDFGLTDIGLDNLQVLVGCTGAPAPGSVSTTGSVPLCSGGSIVLNLTGQTAASGITTQWQSSTDNITFTNIAGATGTSFTASPTANTYYRVTVTCTNTSQSVNSASFQVNVNNPLVTASTPGTRCGIGTVTLSATGSAGTTVRWYAGATGGSPLGSGANFVTPSIGATTTYYAGAETGNPSLTVGAGGSTSTSYESPYYHLWGGKKSQYMILASELTAAGITPGNLNSLSFNVVAIGTSYSSYSISLKHTSNTSMTTTLETGLTTVYSAASVTPVAGINTYNFLAPFTWNGTQNIIVEVCWSNNNTGGSSASVKMDATSFVAHAYYRNDSQTPAIVCGTTAATATQSLRPQMIFNVDPTYCAGTRTAVVATVTTPPAITVLPSSASVCAGQSQTIGVTSSNAGYTYSWTPGAQTGSPITVTPAATTRYIVTATDNSGGANNGCVNRDSVLVTVNPLPSAPVITANNSTCSGQAVALAAAANSNAVSTLFTENFNGATVGMNVTTGVPATATGTAFAVQTSPYSYNFLTFASPDNSKFMLANSDIGGSGSTTNTNLSTPVLNSTGYSTLSLSFKQFYQYWDVNDTAAVQVSTNAGTTWTTVQSYQPTGQGTTNGFVTTTVNLNAYTGNASLMIRFHYRAVWGFYWAIDDVVITGNGSPNFSWTALPSANAGLPANAGTPLASNSNISVTPTGSGNFVYTVTVANSFGCSISGTKTISITPPAVITSQPINQIGCTGSSATFSVGATGGGLTYQWFKGTTAITGATSSTLTLTNLSAADAASYYVVVTGTCGSPITSSTVTLVVGDDSWTGTSNTDWNNPLNWCGGVPTTTTNVLIPSGTPFSPVVAGNADANAIVINTGATITVNTSGHLNLYGSITGTGTFTATSGTVEFKGAANQNIPAISAAYVILNGAGGVTLNGNMNIGTSLMLTNGNITLGSNNLVMTGGTIGSIASHIVTNGTGTVTNNNINVPTVVFPVGPSATSYNPVMIANGQGRNYTVAVATGITPAIANGSVAVNRTWNITASSAPTTPVSVTLQYADVDMNGTASATANKEVGVYNGTNWLTVSPSGGLAPTGTATARLVAYQTISFGPTVLANQGGINFPLSVPNVDADVTSVLLMPNVIQNNTVLRVNSRRTTNINWTVLDANGRVVMMFGKKIFAGQNDIQLKLGKLASGIYQITGLTDKGKITTVRFVRQ